MHLYANYCSAVFILLVSTLEPGSRAAFLAAFREAADSQGEAECVYRRFSDLGELITMRIHLRFLGAIGARAVLIGTLCRCEAEGGPARGELSGAVR